ncbi:15758_t:CDS:2, partial [Rhizophagus irregularis]
FMRCFSSVFVRHFTPSIPYAIPPTAPPIIPPTISLYIRPSVPLSVSPITCIERSKQGVTFNRELFALIGGVFVFCSFALGNHWSLKNQIEVNEVNEAIEVVNEINEVNEDK